MTGNFRKLLSSLLFGMVILGFSLFPWKSEIHAEEPSVSDRTFTIHYDAADGYGTMEDQIVKWGEPFTLSPNRFQHDDQPFMGWYLQRNSDLYWYTDEQCFMSDIDLNMIGSAKHLFSNGYEFENGIDASWLESSDIAESFTFVAAWNANAYNFDIAEASVRNIVPQSYTGEPLYPELFLYYHGNLLFRNVDYVVSYTDNVEPGTATITAEGRGNYTGTKTVTFQIVPASLKNASVSLEQTSFEYDGTAKEPAPIVKKRQVTLIPGTDYTVSYVSNIHAGRAAVLIEGIGHYTDSKRYNFTITPRVMKEIVISDIPAQTYTGKAIIPEVSVRADGKLLKKDTDYTVSCKDILNVGTATLTIHGKGDYSGSAFTTFTIRPKSISDVKISGLKTVTYNKKAQEPVPTVKDGKIRLVSGTDYTVSYKNNINAGTATVKITGRGNYTGTAKATFPIRPKSIKDVKISGVKTLTFTGKSLSQKKVVVKDGKTKLVHKKDYTLKYKNAKKAGQATLILIGRGNYTGKVKTYFDIRPPKTRLVSVKNPSAGTVSVQWKAAKSGMGYEIQYGTKKTFKNADLVDLPGRTTKSLTLTDLKKGRTYYFRVRAYVIIGNRKLCAGWSKAKKVKIRQ